MKVNRKKFKQGRLPKSREEALANPVKVIGMELKPLNLRGGLEGDYYFILSRPESLEFDCGINIHEPTLCGELTCTAD